MIGLLEIRPRLGFSQTYHFSPSLKKTRFSQPYPNFEFAESCSFLEKKFLDFKTYPFRKNICTYRTCRRKYSLQNLEWD